MGEHAPTEELLSELRRRAQERLDAEDWDAVETLCGRILEIDPDSLDLVKVLGFAQMHMGKYQAAQQTLIWSGVCNGEDNVTRNSLAAIQDAILRTAQTSYALAFMAGRHAYRHYPRLVSIETTAICNATCSFCPHQRLERRSSIMKDELFAKIIADLEQIPRSHEFTVSPNLIGDPFLDKAMFERLALINSRLPQARIALFTNAGFLPQDFAERIVSVRNIALINVSLNFATPEEYKVGMGLDFAKTIANIRLLLNLQRKHKLAIEPVLLSRVRDGSGADERFQNIIADEVLPDFVLGVDYDISLKSRADWLGLQDTGQSRIPYSHPCRSWFDITVLANGIVPHCCMDAEAQYVIGDANRQGLLDIYNSPHYRSLRESATCREHIHPCNTCALLQ